jgi:hypothetical protein
VTAYNQMDDPTYLTKDYSSNNQFAVRSCAKCERQCLYCVAIAVVLFFMLLFLRPSFLFLSQDSEVEGSVDESIGVWVC